MITVRDLAKKLTEYARDNPSDEVMLEYDGDVAFPFLNGTTNQALGPHGVRRFLVFMADHRGDKLVLTRKDRMQ